MQSDTCTAPIAHKAFTFITFMASSVGTASSLMFLSYLSGIMESPRFPGTSFCCLQHQGCINRVSKIKTESLFSEKQKMPIRSQNVPREHSASSLFGRLGNVASPPEGDEHQNAKEQIKGTHEMNPRSKATPTTGIAFGK